MLSLTDPAAVRQVEQDRRPSPRLNLHLSSNNPFLNPALGSPRSLSPGIPSPSPSGLSHLGPAKSPRLNPATNPFLAPHEQAGVRTAGMAANGEAAAVLARPLSAHTTDKADVARQADELFQRFTFLDSNEKADSKDGPPPTAGPVKAPDSGAANHKPSLSDEPMKRRDPRTMRPRPRPAPGPTGEPVSDIFASPDRRPSRRVRRNSDSSVMSKASAAEDERRRRERRRKDADRPPGGSKERTSSKERDSSKPQPIRRRPRGMDLIDRLDQTSIYGAGFIHHDGPFDAVNPHRNRRKDERAPMRAFPAGSANMMLGGSGPLNKGIDLERFHGVGAEGFTDYAAAANTTKKPVTPFDPLTRVDPVHGEESYGLGTSTFLEGAPASRKAILRRESETQAEVVQGGLQRKKSLAQRLRGMSRPQERPPIGPRLNGGPVSPSSSRNPERQVQSAGGASRNGERTGEVNPFDTMYDEAFDKKGFAIKVAEQQRSEDAEKAMTRLAPDGAPRSPIRRAPDGPVVQIAVDNTGEDAENKPVSGFLDRVRSFKGSRRGRQVL